VSAVSQQQQQQQISEVQELQQQQSPQESFAAVIAPLERRAGRPLTEPGRGRCRAAFDQNRDGFEALATDALARGRNPLALLIRMVADGDHRTPAISAEPNRCGCFHPQCQWQDRCLEQDAA
jgi:hypothetical protein